MAPSGRRWNYMPRSVLRRISYHVPCKFDRVRMQLVCHSWYLRHLPPLPPQLPWLLHPLAGGPAFSCLFSGADDLRLHRVRVPADLRSARFFGSYDGGWLFLASGRTTGNILLNLRTGRRIPIPETPTSSARQRNPA
uniref:KIB1-4 beta-propeller domain-containing protein n=2 Tax=Oryza brachyantha TaxID=4533 RepID=J3M9W9_ORYBR